MIYLITNTVNNKRYIGKTIRAVEERWYYHLDSALKRNSQTHLHRAIRKYGADAFVIEGLCDGLNDEEIKMIAELKPEYNMTKGGDGGDTSMSPNYKKSLISRRSYAGENNPMYGKKGILNPNYGKKYGKNPKISRAKMKKLLSSDGNIFIGFKEMFNYYDVKSYYSLKKKGITWSEINDDRIPLDGKIPT